MHLTYYSKKDLRLDRITMQITDEGWFMEHECYTGHCDKGGRPQLLYCMRENYADYPPAFSDALEELWDSAHDKGLSERDIQDSLDYFSHWIINYERTHSPRPIEI